MTDIDKQYWKIKDFADHFGLDKSTVYNQIERGEIRAIRIGKTALRIPTDEVKRILDSFVAPASNHKTWTPECGSSKPAPDERRRVRRRVARGQDRGHTPECQRRDRSACPTRGYATRCRRPAVGLLRSSYRRGRRLASDSRVVEAGRSGSGQLVARPLTGSTSTR